MQQQINLYLLLPKKSQFQINLRSIIFIYVACLGLLLALGSYESWYNRHLTKQIDALSQEIAQTQQRLAVISAQYSTLDAKEIQKTIDKLKLEIHSKENAINILLPLAGAPAYMTALAQAAIPNVWLAEFNFNMVEGGANLKGNALKATQPKEFMEQLQQQSVFSKMRFELRELSEAQADKDQKAIVNFYITTKAKS